MDVPRCAGVLLPLFSLRTVRGWGLGELPDLAAFAPWMERAGLRVLMTLPLLEVALGQASPYSALSAFALDPAYVALEEVEDFGELGGEPALPPDDRAALEAVRASAHVEWATIRRLKEKWLRRCFARFTAAGASSQRAQDLAAFRERERGWLPDYCLFRALKDADPLGWWRATWPAPLRDREPPALERARDQHAQDIAFREYVQWLAHRQLDAARAEARHFGVLFGGDLPFMVAEDSADAWARQAELRFDASIGAPPDDYSAEGQDWGLPVYRWDVMADRGLDWLRLRGAKAAAAFDLVRVDHVVGFYRTFVRPHDGRAPYFSPSAERAQLRQGEAVLATLRAGGSFLIAEDLGTVPSFVRRSLAKLGVPGFRVLRWEKDDDVWRDPAGWPALSVATTGTHDTEPIAPWWEGLSSLERAALCRLERLRGHAHDLRFTPEVHRALLETISFSGSDFAVLPIQDVFGLRDRINVPGTTGARNWSWRLPWTLPRLSGDPPLRAQVALLRKLMLDSRRA